MAQHNPNVYSISTARQPPWTAPSSGPNREAHDLIQDDAARLVHRSERKMRLTIDTYPILIDGRAYPECHTRLSDSCEDGKEKVREESGVAYIYRCNTLCSTCSPSPMECTRLLLVSVNTLEEYQTAGNQLTCEIAVLGVGNIFLDDSDTVRSWTVGESGLPSHERGCCTGCV